MPMAAPRTLSSVSARRAPRTACLFLGSMLLVTAAASRAQPSADAAVALGKAALAEGRYEEALKHFEDGAKADRQAENRFRFYRALALQQQAESEPRKRESRLRRARKLYRKFLKNEPGSGAAHNNLAQVQRMLRRFDVEHLAAAEARETAARQRRDLALRRRAQAREGLQRAAQNLREVEQQLESGATSEADLEKAAQKAQAWKRALVSESAKADRADSELRAAQVTVSTYRSRLDHASQEAADSYRRAIELGESRRSIYLKNYAEYLDELGDWQAATASWNLLATQQPESEQPHRALMARYIESVPSSLAGQPPPPISQVRARSEELAAYLWGLLQRRQPARAVDAALEALEERQSWAEDVQGEMLTVVAVGLARRLYEPNELDETATGKRLAELAESSPVGAGAAQLLALHTADPSFDPASYRWWRQGDLERDPPRGVWPADGFRELIRSIGLHHQQQGRPPAAERFFRLAAEFRDREADPLAVGNLVDLYLDDGRFDRVQQLASEYEPRLALADAGRSSQVEKVFDYRRTLGGVYALVGAWGGEGQSNSAISQLGQALAAYNRLKERAPAAAAKVYRQTPEVTDLLARGYAATGRAEDNYALRLEAAERFQQKKDREAVLQVLGPILHQPPPPEVSPAIRKRYRRAVEDPEVQDLEALEQRGIEVDQPALDVHPNVVTGRLEARGSIVDPGVAEQRKQLEGLGRHRPAVELEGQGPAIEPEPGEPETREQENRKRAAELERLADAHLKRGDEESAKRYYRQALELVPDNQRIREILRRMESR